MSDTEIRPFEIERDLAAVKKIWQEVGWVEDENDLAQLDHFFADGNTIVATVNDQPECSVHTLTGNMQIAKTQLPMLAVTAVTTSHLGRGRAFAQKLTAQQVIRAQNEGMSLTALGMFDQGFYDRLGFATGAYEQEIAFDPGSLKVDIPTRPAVRLTLGESAEMHAAMRKRFRSHGSVVLDSPTVFRAELGFGEKSFGLGFRDADGVLSHFMWLDPQDNPAHGPYEVRYMAYRKPEDILELLGLLKSLSDQIYSVSMIEPPELQMQMLLARPLRNMDLSKGSKHESRLRSFAWWQARILDMAQVVPALADASQSLEFEARVTDPLAKFDSNAGIGGTWHLTLGPGAKAERCAEGSGLPVLTTSVNALSRLLLGVGAASRLALTDELSASVDLLAELDAALHLPSPVVGWDF